MGQIWNFLFDTSNWPPRWYCGSWTDTLGWVHIVSDSAIFLAYFAIPTVLGYWFVKRRDFPFHSILLLFALFIMSCGIGHLVEATIFWYPAYRFSGLVKVVTAAVSWITVIALIPLIPKVLHFPKLQKINQLLKQESQQMESKLNRTALELGEVKREMDDFLHIVSHDLRGPLINIKGFSGELNEAFENISPILSKIKDQLDDEERSQITKLLNEDIVQSIKFINESVQKVDFLFESLIKFSKITTQTYKIEEVSMQKIVEDQLKEHHQSLNKYAIEVKVGQLPQVMADKEAMKKIVHGLIDNAIRYRKKDSRAKIEISADTTQDVTTFFVKDNGIGILEKDKKKIFTFFNRGATSDQKGYGMGLAYIKAMVQLQNGKIEFESKEGVGTQFMLSFKEVKKEG